MDFDDICDALYKFSDAIEEKGTACIDRICTPIDNLIYGPDKSASNTKHTGKDRSLEKGDVIFVNRNGGLYQHYGIYSGDWNVIHYASRTSDFGDDICVHETSLNAFLQGGMCLAIDFSETYNTGNNRRIIVPTIPGIVHYPKPINPCLNVFELAAYIIKSMNYHVYSGEETVKRARSKLGEDKYNLIFNNCEHFAIWCKTGIKESQQVENVLKVLLKEESYE